MPPTPSSSGLPRQDKPKTNSSKARLVNKTPKGRGKKVVLKIFWQKNFNGKTILYGFYVHTKHFSIIKNF